MVWNTAPDFGLPRRASSLDAREKRESRSSPFYSVLYAVGLSRSATIRVIGSI